MSSCARIGLASFVWLFGLLGPRVLALNGTRGLRDSRNELHDLVQGILLGASYRRLPLTGTPHARVAARRILFQACLFPSSHVCCHPFCLDRFPFGDLSSHVFHKSCSPMSRKQRSCRRHPPLQDLVSMPTLAAAYRTRCNASFPELWGGSRSCCLVEISSRRSFGTANRS